MKTSIKLEDKNGTTQVLTDVTNIVVPSAETGKTTTYTVEPIISFVEGGIPGIPSATGRTSGQAGSIAKNSKIYVSAHNFNQFYLENKLYLIAFKSLSTGLTPMEPSDMIDDIKVVTSDNLVSGTLSGVNGPLGTYTDTEIAITLGCDETGPYASPTDRSGTVWSDTYGGNTIFVIKIVDKYYHIFVSMGAGIYSGNNKIAASISSSSSGVPAHAYYYSMYSHKITSLYKTIQEIHAADSSCQTGYWAKRIINDNGEGCCLAETMVQSSSSAVYGTFAYGGGAFFPTGGGLKI